MYKYKSAKQLRTFDTYDYVDSYVYMGVHDILKYYKNGFSKVTDHACREIRYGRLDKHQAINLIKKFQKEPDKYSNLFCEWININHKSLKFILNEYRNKLIWNEKSPNMWKQNFPKLKSSTKKLKALNINLLLIIN